jgi:hypothetical protein
MPSIIPSYLYTIFASIIVGTLVIAMCALTTVNIKAEAEKQQLSNISDYVATKGMELIAGAPPTNFTLKTAVDVPPLIGNQRYWIQLSNDSAKVTVTAGFGTVAVRAGQEAVIPSGVYASGVYVSGSGAAFLQYQSNSSGLYLTLLGGH